MPDPSEYRLLYVAGEGLRSSVFDSQVFLPLRELKKSGVEVSLAVMELFDTRIDRLLRRKLLEIEKALPGCTYFRGMPMVCRTTSWLDGKRVASAARRKGMGGANTVIHARGHFASYSVICGFGGERVVADIRGLVGAELRHYAADGLRSLGKSFRIREIERIEERVVTRARKILCVSNVLKRYLVETHRIEEGKVTVVPTLVDTHIFRYDPDMRQRMRKRLGIEDRIAFIYSGGMAAWQLPQETVSLFREIKCKIPEAFLIFLTHRSSEAAPVFAGMDQRDYYLGSAGYSDIPGYLNAADIGILLREPNPVNAVASPTKFGEYLCCGLPVLLTRSIGDSEETIRATGGGEVLASVESVPDEGRVTALQKIDRTALAETGRRRYSAEVNIFLLRRVHEEVLRLR